MRVNQKPQKLGDIISGAKPDRKKGPPAYEWQDLALRIIKELNVPEFKKNSVFKVCKETPKPLTEQCLNDTKELCQTGERWRYFFKLINRM